MRLPVELLIVDKKNHRKLVSVPLLLVSKRSELIDSAKAYVKQSWRGYTLISVHEGRLFNDG